MVWLSSVAVLGAGWIFIKLPGAGLPLFYQRPSVISDNEYLNMTDINNNVLCSLKNCNKKLGKEYDKCPQWKSKLINHVSLWSTDT